MKRNRQSAFSLVELIVVAAVIAVIIGFAVPAANNLIKGSQLTQGSQAFGDVFSFARQNAMSRGRPVEIRFYRYGDLDTPGEEANKQATWRYHGYQLFEILENGAALPINKMQRLPRMVTFSTAPDNLYKYSTLICPLFRGAPKLGLTDKTAPEIPVTFATLKGTPISVGRKYDYQSFRFLPDGSTDLPPTTKSSPGGGGQPEDSWYITLVGLNDDGRDINTINFYTVQIDPVTGTTKTFRSGGS